MNQFLRDIEEFHRKFAQDYVGPPRVLPVDVFAFRVKFLREEHKEMIDSNVDQDLPELLDAFVDYAYVLFGTVHLAGMSELFQRAWDDVHAKNMQKELASDVNPSKRGYEKDIVKPLGWTPPDHSHLFANHVPVATKDSHIATELEGEG